MSVGAPFIYKLVPAASWQQAELLGRFVGSPADLADGRTMAELAPDEKDAISHRGRAARALAERLAKERP